MKASLQLSSLLLPLLVVLLASALAAAGAFAALWLRARRHAAGAVAALLEAEGGRQLLEASIEAVPCNLAVFAPDGALAAWNTSYEALHPHAFAAARSAGGGCIREPLRYADLMREAARRTLPPDQVEAEVAARVARHFGEASSLFERQYPDGRWMRISKQRLPSGHVAGFALDITEMKAREQKLALNEARLKHLAHHDPLTGLGNRARFDHCLGDAVGRPGGCTLLLVDLDHFKAANDQHGHGVGDALLRVASARIAAALRADDLAFRLGGDEFAVLLDGVDAMAAEAAAARLVDALGQPYQVGTTVVRLSASIGIASAPLDACTGDALVHAADLALYAVKRAGRAGAAFYDARMASTLLAAPAAALDPVRGRAA